MAKSRSAGEAVPIEQPGASPAADENSIVNRSGGFRQEPPDRLALIAVAAYYRAERRGFAPGHEQEDWLAAEREIDATLDSPADGASRGPPN
jgi:hypothetical protein